MEVNPVVWFEIYVQDMQRARVFYENVLGIQLRKEESREIEMYVFPMLESGVGISGALVKMEGRVSGGNSTIVYFTCADCAEEAGKAVENGGEILREKFSIGQYGFAAVVTDSEGNAIGLHSMQ